MKPAQRQKTTDFIKAVVFCFLNNNGNKWVENSVRM